MAPLGFIHVMGGNQKCQSFCSQLMDLFPEFSSGFRVDPRGWFIEQQQSWLMDQASSQCKPLLPPTRELTGQLLSTTGQSQPFKTSCHRSTSIRNSEHACHKVQILLNAQILIETESLCHVAHSGLNGVALPNDVMA